MTCTKLRVTTGLSELKLKLPGSSFRRSERLIPMRDWSGSDVY
jgi:hypothetical protein